MLDFDCYFLAYIFLSQSPPPCRQPHNTSPIFLPFSLLTSASIFLFFFKHLANLPKPPKIVQKAPKTLPKTLPQLHQNRILSCNARNPRKIRPSYTKPSFLTFSCLRKSSQNRCQNPFIIGSILTALLETPKILIWMLKRRQDGPQKFHYFSKNPLKIATFPVFGSCCFLEASKSLPRASQEPAKRLPGGVQALRRHPRAPRKLPCSKMKPKRPPISIKNSAILLATSVQMLRGRR